MPTPHLSLENISHSFESGNHIPFIWVWEPYPIQLSLGTRYTPFGIGTTSNSLEIGNHAKLMSVGLRIGVVSRHINKQMISWITKFVLFTQQNIYVIIYSYSITQNFILTHLNTYQILKNISLESAYSYGSTTLLWQIYIKLHAYLLVSKAMLLAVTYCQLPTWVSSLHYL